ncbi:hypothetical protein D3C83_84650 [compost metagenome]
MDVTVTLGNGPPGDAHVIPPSVERYMPDVVEVNTVSGSSGFTATAKTVAPWKTSVV